VTQPLSHRIRALLTQSSGPLSTTQLQQRLHIESPRRLRDAIKQIARSGGAVHRHRGLCPVEGCARQLYWAHPWKPQLCDLQLGRPRVRNVADAKQLRGSQKGSRAGGEAYAEKMFAERTGHKRERFPSDKPTLRGRHIPLTLHQQVRLNRWAVTAQETL
jgi:hypothetical protein